MSCGSAHAGRWCYGDYVRGGRAPTGVGPRCRGAESEARGVSRRPSKTPQQRVRPNLPIQTVHLCFAQMLSENPFVVVTRCACQKCGDTNLWPRLCLSDAVPGEKYCFSCPHPCTDSCSPAWCNTDRRCELRVCHCVCDEIRDRKRKRQKSDKKWRGESSLLKWPKTYDARETRAPR